MADVIRGGELWNASEPNTTMVEWDPANPGGWVTTDENESYIHQELVLGPGQVLLRTLHKNTRALLERNRRLLNENAGKRWGDGQVVASWPLNIYMHMFAEAKKNLDQKYITKKMNDIDYRNFRTFPGDI